MGAVDFRCAFGLNRQALSTHKPDLALAGAERWLGLFIAG
jgi:hypothetical protein